MALDRPTDMESRLEICALLAPAAASVAISLSRRESGALSTAQARGAVRAPSHCATKFADRVPAAAALDRNPSRSRPSDAFAHTSADPGRGPRGGSGLPHRYGSSDPRLRYGCHVAGYRSSQDVHTPWMRHSRTTSSFAAAIGSTKASWSIMRQAPRPNAPPARQRPKSSDRGRGQS
jgi:hypothetical protein